MQLSTPEEIFIVDPIVLPDLRPMWELLASPGREIVTVAARQEIKFCAKGAGAAPACVLDLQVAAGLLGYGYPLSHTNLCLRILNAQVNGGESFTDWRKRPLRPVQLEYAADDVRYLLPMREKILARGAEAGPHQLGSRRMRSSGEDRDARGRALEDLRQCAAQPPSACGAAGSVALARPAGLRPQRSGCARAGRQHVDRNGAPLPGDRRGPVLDSRPGQPDAAQGRAGSGGCRCRSPLDTGSRSSQQRAARRPSAGCGADQTALGGRGNLAAETDVDTALLATTSDLQEIVRWFLDQEGTPSRR